MVIGRIYEEADPEEIICGAVEEKSDYADLLESLKDIDKIYHQASLYEQERHILLRKAVIDQVDLAHLVVFRSPKNYEELKKTIGDCVLGKESFHSGTLFTTTVMGSREPRSHLL